MADTYLLIDDSGTVVNSMLWDGDESQWQPPAGLRAVKSVDGHWGDGWKWDGQRAYDPSPPPASVLQKPPSDV